MRRYTQGTPCPGQNAPNPSFASTRYSDYDNTTTNLDYTTEFQAQQQLRHAKPRRPLRASRKSAFNPGLDIFEDVAQEEEQQHRQMADVKRRSRSSIMPRLATEKRSTILAHPAQKISVAAPPAQHAQPVKTQRRRVSQILTDRQVADVNATLQLQEDVLERRELRKQGPKKDPRRRTIYVPSDDTTVMTIHPGQRTHQPRIRRERSPDIGLDLVTLSEEEGSLVSSLKGGKKAPRKSLAVPPKRVPLQQATRSFQGSSFSEDVHGQGGGKENVPPGLEITFDFGKLEAKKPAPKPARVHFNSNKAPEPVAHTKSRTEGTQKRLRSQASYDGSAAKSMKTKVDSTASRKSATTSLKESAVSRRPPPTSTLKSVIKNARLAKLDRTPPGSSPFHNDKSPPSALRRQKRTSDKVSSLYIVGQPQEKPLGKAQNAREKYPVLSEDLTRPELYEDQWLTYQEVAITQLLNSLFESSDTVSDAEQSVEDIRAKMLALYQDPSIPLLHKRIQASLQCGALSIPKDMLSQTLRLKDDVGMRKKFLNLWVKTYDLTALRAAAETIVGRKITTQCRLSSGSTCSDDGSRQFRAERRAIEAFLDTFLIKNEDAVRVKTGGGSIASITRGDHQGDEFGTAGWTWRRTMLRSLMLILLLDQAKTADVVPGCLFQTTSPHKTSEQVLHCLANMLLPSVGDVTRPLGHFNYKVKHTQFPLEEYTYHIENIAIDLRDGVILTRLVELLLYPLTTLVTERDETVTISMPTGELLTSTFDFDQKESWLLSQHLKYPAIGRPQKLYNVLVALSALTGVRGIPVQAVGGIKPEDIVDGHREKTLSLLWSLVGKCGLSTFVDWPQIVKEIERFRESWYTKRDIYAQRDLDSDAEDDATTELEGQGLEYHKRLLLSWARSIARLHGLRVSNLTTSFSDPRVLESIVDTYLPSTMISPSMANNTQLSLPAKLKATGCSSSFIALFTSQNGAAKTIPSKDFTLLTLSFLASRLLPLSLTHRAASVIQRAYRLRLARQTVHKRIALMRVAHDCAEVARKRETLVNAAIVIQTCWKQILDQRRAQLEVDIELFQALARGWAIRRWVRRVTGGRVGGKEKVRRMRGGW